MPLGLKRYQTQGHLHFITFSCHRREPHLTRHYTLFEQSLEKIRKRYNLEVHGYVLMPEHVHLLLSEPATEPLAKALQALKLSVSKQADSKPFWQPATTISTSSPPGSSSKSSSTRTKTPSPEAWSKLLKTGPTPAISTTTPALHTPPST